MMVDRSKKSLFFDMDGVLADFYADPNCLEKMSQEGYFRNLKPLPMTNTLSELILRYSNVFEFYILSACVRPIERVKQEKKDWCRQYLPMIGEENMILMPAGESKFDYIPKGITDPILFDDYSKNIEDWEAQGGHAFKIKNNINLKNNRDYRRILDRPSAEDIVSEIIRLGMEG